jgi:hypothetical protein
MRSESSATPVARFGEGVVQLSVGPAEQVAAGGAARRVVLVAGSGRSGTSTMAGVLATLGLSVPQPEVPANESHPKGFHEPRWAVSLHANLLDRANVRMTDGRPDAVEAAAGAVDEAVQERLRSWLLGHFSDTGPELVVKDPRLVWFLDPWRAAARGCDAQPSVITMVRPVPEVVGSKQSHHSRSREDVAATVAGWVNTMLTCELTTRGWTRVFVRYSDLLDRWRIPLTRIGERLDLSSIRSAPPGALRAVDDFIDPSLRRAQLTWRDVSVPNRLRELADVTWHELDHLVDALEDTAEFQQTFDELRAAYRDYYTECEAVAHWTAVAARREGSAAYRLSRVLPHGVREAVPPGTRRLLRTVLEGRTTQGRTTQRPS